MPTPVGHSLVGAALYLAFTPAERPLGHWRTGLLCVAAASAADLDFLAGAVTGDWNRFHQGVSHSLAVALALGLVLASLPLASLGGWGRRWGLFTALTLSHLALDVVTRDARPPYGIPLLWPLSSTYVHSPVDLFPNVRRGSLGVVLAPANWWAIAVETVTLAPVLAAAALLRGRRRAARFARTRG